VIMNDGTKIKAELVGVDKKTDIAVLKFKPVKPLVAVKFGDSDKLRLGEWVIAIGNPVQPRRLGHGRHRLGAQPRHQPGAVRQLHPDRRLHQPRQFRRTAVQPRRRGGRRQHADHLADRRFDRPRLRGAVEDGGGVVDQLRQFGELRRGWLGVRIQQVTDEIAESLNIKPPAARWLPASTTRGRPSPPASSPATSSSSSTARTSRTRRISRASSPTPRSARKSTW
jgi:serine protease Do